MARRTFAVIGLGRFGSAIATTLAELGQEVIGIDVDEDRVRAMSDVLTQVVQLDAIDEKALRAVGIQDVDVAVISIGAHVEASLLIVTIVKEMGIKTIIAKATTPIHGRILEKIGVSRVVFPEREMGVRLGRGLVMPNVLDYVELSGEYSIIEIPAPPEFAGRTLRQLQLRSRSGLTLIAVKRSSGTGLGEIVNAAPSPDEPIRDNDVLVLLGSNDRLVQLDKLLKR